MKEETLYDLWNITIRQLLPASPDVRCYEGFLTGEKLLCQEVHVVGWALVNFRAKPRPDINRRTDELLLAVIGNDGGQRFINPETGICGLTFEVYPGECFQVVLPGRELDKEDLKADCEVARELKEEVRS